MMIPSMKVHPWHAHFWRRAADRGLTRRSFFQGSAGVVGALAGLGLAAPGMAKTSSANPKPIPGGLPLPPPFPEIIHVEAPGVLTPADSEPITITDFNGNIGYAVVDGTGTGRDTVTGATKPYSFNVDMRFMQGVYVGEDGGIRHRTFGFIWLDIFDSPVGAQANQIHDYHPPIAPNGVFWTVEALASVVDVNPGAGRASFVMHDLSVPDYGNIPQSFFPGASVPATVSFDIRWHDVLERTNRRNANEGFAGEFVVTKATAAWSSRQDGFEFVSDPAETSVSEHAIVGHERNGVFF